MKNKLTKKAFCFFAFTLFISGLAFSQTNKIIPDPRLKDVLSESKIIKLQTNAPSKLEYYNFLLNNYCTVEKEKPLNGIFKGDISSIKPINGVVALNPETFDIKTFNIYMYEVGLDLDKLVYYSIGNTNSYLVFLSVREFSKRYKSQNKSK